MCHQSPVIGSDTGIAALAMEASTVLDLLTVPNSSWRKVLDYVHLTSIAVLVVVI